MTIIIAALTSAWAWALPWAGPALGLASRLAARARGIVPAGTGGTLLVGAVALVLAWAAWSHFSTWIWPPPRTYTAAEVNADRLAREVEMLRRAAAEKQRSIEAVQRQLAAAEKINQGLYDENEKLRQAAPADSGLAFTDSDPWLQRKRARSGQPPAGAAGR